MESLAPEVLTYILEFLDLNEVLKCRLVNHKFRSTIELNFRPKGLTCRARQSCFEYLSYPFDHASIRGDTLFSTDKLNVGVLNSEVLREPLKNLRQLNINFAMFLPKTPNHLIRDCFAGINRLQKLERLRIEFLHLHLLNKSELKLPRLKYLAVKRVCVAQNSKLRIVAPSLVGFETELDLGAFEFHDYGRISELKMKAYHDAISKFKNLERLYLERLHYQPSGNQLYQLPDDFLKPLERLTELHWSHEYANRVPSILAATRNLNRRVPFRPYYNGVLVTEQSFLLLRTRLDRSKLTRQEHCFDLILRNYDSLLERLQYNTYVDYSAVMTHFQGRIPSTFFGKFTNLQKLECKAIEDVAHFTEFLKQCRCLAELRFNDSGLDQEFFGRLYLFQPLLLKLAVLERKVVDCRFIYNLHNLSELEIAWTPTYSMTIELFSQKPNFYSFLFRINHRISQIYSREFYGQSRHFFRVNNCAIPQVTRSALIRDMCRTLTD